MQPPERSASANPGGRRKLEPDPEIRVAIVSAASDIVRKEGVGALSIAQVLTRAQLSTRAFYRHFDSKDQLVAALFLAMARVEMLRLRQIMAAAPDPVRAVAAWIDGRLDLAFNDDIRSDLRKMSLEAQSQMFTAPELVGPAYDEILRPLVEQLSRGGDVDSRSRLVQHRTPMGRRRLQRRRSARTGATLLSARPRGRPRDDHGRPRHIWIASTQLPKGRSWIWAWQDRLPSSRAEARGWAWPSRRHWPPRALESR